MLTIGMVCVRADAQRRGLDRVVLDTIAGRAVAAAVKGQHRVGMYCIG